MENLGILPGSSVVGVALPNGQVKIAYEGFMYPHQEANYENGLKIATSRLVCDYPTIAKMTVPSTSLEAVGVLQIK